jgi:ribosomal subunit interface protein
MNIAFQTKNLADVEKKFFEEYAEKRIKSLEKWISHFPDDACNLEIHIEKFATKEAYKVIINLRIPNYSFYASEDDHTIEEAVDKTKDKIKRQLLKGKDKNLF